MEAGDLPIDCSDVQPLPSFQQGLSSAWLWTLVALVVWTMESF